MLFLFPTLLFAQPYKSFFYTGKISRWNIFPNVFPAGTSKYTVEADTIVNGKTWRYFHENSGINVLSGFLREDTMTGKVWFKGINVYAQLLVDTSEKLVCDFALQAHDSFNYTCKIDLLPWYNCDIKIRVDTVFYLNGLKHIHFDPASFAGAFTTIDLMMIEGVGTNYGFHYMFTPSSMATVQCQYRDSDLFYSNRFVPLPNNCNVSNMDGIADVFSTNTKKQIVYPNPACNFISISAPSYDKLEIINSLGQTVIETMETENIALNRFPDGVYWIKVYKNNQLTGCSKFSKISE